MRLFPPEPVIAPDEGFNPEKDIFGYADFGERLKGFYASFDEPLVGVLDAPWGSGKSTFIKMWCGHMRNQGYPVIEFDAFKNDYTDDAFLALAGEVVLLAEDLNGEAEEARKDFIDKAAKVALAAGKGGLKALIKKAVTEEGAEELETALAGAAEGTVDGLGAAIKEKLGQRKQEKKAFEEFGNTLSALSEQLGRSEDEGEEGKPLIFVIDELDRCKPTFALALLEKIKHFFSVPNVQFLLVTNLDQLSKVVKCEYGSEIDGEKYLQKFYDMSFSLPKKNSSGRAAVERVFCSYVVDSCETKVNVEWFKALVEHKQMCLRAILKMHAHAAAMTGINDNINFGYEMLFLGLACLQIEAPELFKKTVTGSLLKNDVESFFDVSNDKMAFYQAIFLYVMKSLPSDDENYNAASYPFRYGIRDDLLQTVACEMAQLNFPE